MIKKLKLKSDFSRNVVTLMTGTTIAQAIPIAITPILTRLYTPEDFGLYALYLSVVTTISVIVTGRYELAIMLPKKNVDAIYIFTLSLLIIFCISLITLIVILLFNQELTVFLGNEDLSFWLYLVPIAIFINGLYQSLNYLNTRHNNYKDIAKSKILNSAVNGTVNIGSSLSLSGPSGLVIGSILGRMSGLFFLWKIFPKKLFFNKNKIIALAKKYKKFPLINSLHAFINISKDNIVNILISIYYSANILGFYFFVLRIMKMPGGLLGTSLAQVFYSKASTIYNETKNIQMNVIKLIRTLALMALLPAIFLFIFSEELFIFVFGENWSEAGRYAEAMVPYIYFHFIASPLGMVPLVTNKQDKAFYWGVLESVLFLLVFVVGNYIYHDLYKTLNILSLVFSIYFPIYFIWIYSISKEKTL